jgi:hypothetical protein
MKKETKKEWTAHCRTCTWSGRRTGDQAVARKEVDAHFKTHSLHNVRLLVTGADKVIDEEAERMKEAEEWRSLIKPPAKG